MHSHCMRRDVWSPKVTHLPPATHRNPMNDHLQRYKMYVATIACLTVLNSHSHCVTFSQQKQSEYNRNSLSVDTHTHSHLSYRLRLSQCSPVRLLISNTRASTHRTPLNDHLLVQQFPCYCCFSTFCVAKCCFKNISFYNLIIIIIVPPTLQTLYT